MTDHELSEFDTEIFVFEWIDEPFEFEPLVWENTREKSV